MPHVEDLASARKKLAQVVADQLPLSLTTYEAEAILKELYVLDEVRAKSARVRFEDRDTFGHPV